MKYYFNLKYFFSILIYFKMYFCKLWCIFQNSLIESSKGNNLFEIFDQFDASLLNVELFNGSVYLQIALF